MKKKEELNIMVNIKMIEELKAKLEAMSGKTVEAVYIIDSSVLGGIKIEIDGKTIDGSITNNLKRIKGVMNG